IERSQDLVYIRIALFDTRPVAQKQALFRALVDRLGRDPGLRPEDVFIVLEPIAKENWSVGRGDMQFAPGRPSHG
ncbi:MAG: tautomerase family protein, partial [Pseudomonadota bacterium]